MRFMLFNVAWKLDLAYLEDLICYFKSIIICLYQ